MLAVAPATSALCALIGQVLAILSGTRGSFTPSEAWAPLCFDPEPNWKNKETT